MEKTKSYELIVIGGGPSGITLAKKLGSKMNMAMVRPGYLNIKVIENV